MKRARFLIGTSAGNAILSSIMMAGIVAGAATVAYKNFNNTYSSTRVARIKAKQAVVEAQVRRRALQPDAYVECNSSNLATCRVNTDYFSDLGNQKIVGSRCDSKTSVCGVAATNIKINPGTRVFSADVSYEGSEVKLKPLTVQLEVPIEVLQAPRFHCGEKDKSKPIFTGFDSAGAPICEGFTACRPGEFVKGIDVSKRKLICQALPTNVSCPAANMFTALRWNGGAVDANCGSMPEPPFTSRSATRQIASSDPNGQATNDDGGGGPGEDGNGPVGGGNGGGGGSGNGNGASDSNAAERAPSADPSCPEGAPCPERRRCPNMVPVHNFAYSNTEGFMEELGAMSPEECNNRCDKNAACAGYNHLVGFCYLQAHDTQYGFHGPHPFTGTVFGGYCH